MALTIMLAPEDETRLRESAARGGLSPEQLAMQRLLEADLLWRIRVAAPAAETRELHRLLRRRSAGRLTQAERAHLQMLLDEREQRGAQRLQDLAQLARLCSIPELMERLGMRPIPAP